MKMKLKKNQKLFNRFIYYASKVQLRLLRRCWKLVFRYICRKVTRRIEMYKFSGQCGWIVEKNTHIV